MTIFSSPHFENHENIIFCHDQDSGLKAIIAIHDTRLGPSVGGCRMWPYNTEQEAIIDALRLSRGMTYKNALARLPWGGGKSVIIGDSYTDKSPELFQKFGSFIQQLGGQYTVAEDVGTAPSDMEEIAKKTSFVLGTKKDAGDPSPGTAFGVFKGIEASVTEALNVNSLRNIKLAVQGLGHVGFDVAKLLSESGAKLCVTDIHDKNMDRAKKQLNAIPVEPDQIYDQDVDVFVPCALGAILNKETIPRLKASVVAGAANNQLASDEDSIRLHERGILYAPDYVINAGGVIYLYHQQDGANKKAAMPHIAKIGETLSEIYTVAKQQKISPSRAADQIAERRLEKAI